MNGLPDHKKQFLSAVGYTSEELAQIDEAMAAMAAKAKQQGIRSKEASVAEPPAQPAEEPVQEQQPDKEAQVKEAQAMLVKALEPVLAPINAALATLQAEVVALKQQSNTPLTPAASALAAKSITQQQEGAHVLSGKGDKGPKENNSDKEAQAHSVTDINFLDNLIALNQQRPQAN